MRPVPVTPFRITPDERQRIHEIVDISDAAINRLTEAQVRGFLESAPDESPGEEFAEFQTDHEALPPPKVEPKPLAGSSISPTPESPRSNGHNAESHPSVPFMTAATMQQLHERGCTDDQIREMKPAEAHRVLKAASPQPSGNAVQEPNGSPHVESPPMGENEPPERDAPPRDPDVNLDMWLRGEVVYEGGEVLTAATQRFHKRYINLAELVLDILDGKTSVTISDQEIHPSVMRIVNSCGLGEGSSDAQQGAPPSGKQPSVVNGSESGPVKPPRANGHEQPSSIAPEAGYTVIKDEPQRAEAGWRGAETNGHTKTDDAGDPHTKTDDRGKAKPVRFKLLSFDELKSSTALYLVKGLFPRNGLVIVWGPPKWGKSFWIFTVAMHIALGWEYRGHRVKQDEVVYLVLEGQAGFGNRKEAFKHRFLKPDQTVPAFKLCDVSLNLIKDHRQLIADIRAQHANPGCIIIDTMNRSLVGSESSDEDMSAYLNAATAVQQAFNCLIVIIHHCGIDDSRPRGHTSQTGAVDVQISVKKDEGAGIVTATVDLAKDMAEGATFASKLTVVELGTDPDGDPITSCVVEPVEAEPEAENQAQRRGKKQGKKRDRLPKKAQIALRALREAADELGAEPPASNHIPPKVKTVTVDQWRQYAYARGISDGEERAQQKAFKEASDHLIAEQFVGSWNNARWVANKDEN
jgi:hypothetical protein